MKCSKLYANNCISAGKEVFFMHFCNINDREILPGKLFNVCIINKCKIIIEVYAKEHVTFLNLLRSKVRHTLLKPLNFLKWF